MAISKQKSLLVELVKTGSIKVDLLTCTKQDLSAVRSLVNQKTIEADGETTTTFKAISERL